MYWNMNVTKSWICHIFANLTYFMPKTATHVPSSRSPVVRRLGLVSVHQPLCYPTSWRLCRVIALHPVTRTMTTERKLTTCSISPAARPLRGRVQCLNPCFHTWQWRLVKVADIAARTGGWERGGYLFLIAAGQWGGASGLGDSPLCPPP